MRPVLAIAVLLIASLAVPPAAAQGGSEDVDCGYIPEVGIVPWTLCMATAARGAAETIAGEVVGMVPGLACAAWWLIWGPGAPCPISPPA